MTNDDAGTPDDGLISEGEKSRYTDRTVGRECEWCGEWMPYYGIGRQPRYCSPAHRQRAYEIRTAERRRGRDADAGLLREQPVRELVERKETVTRTVVRYSLPWHNGPLRAPRSAAEWTRMLATLAKILPRDHLQNDPDWPELEAAARKLGVLLDEHPARRTELPKPTPGLSDGNDFVLPPPSKPVPPSAKKKARRKGRRR